MKWKHVFLLCHLENYRSTILNFYFYVFVVFLFFEMKFLSAECHAVNESNRNRSTVKKTYKGIVSIRYDTLKNLPGMMK